jgi:glucose uptake protein GlcU
MLVLAMMVAAGLLGTAMNQRAYQLAPISYSMPLVNVVDIIVAVAFGAAVYGELPGHSAPLLGLQLTALGCVAVGLRAVSELGTGAEATNVEPRSEGETTGGAVPAAAGARL